MGKPYTRFQSRKCSATHEAPALRARQSFTYTPLPPGHMESRFRPARTLRRYIYIYIYNTNTHTHTYIYIYIYIYMIIYVSAQCACQVALGKAPNPRQRCSSSRGQGFRAEGISGAGGCQGGKVLGSDCCVVGRAGQ